MALRCAAASSTSVFCCTQTSALSMSMLGSVIGAARSSWTLLATPRSDL